MMLVATHASGPRALLVVPDGLTAVNGVTQPRVSHVFEGVLRKVLALARDGDVIYLAPANTFGGPLSEQTAAHRFLVDHACAGEVISFETDRRRYIDTRGNASLLREYLVQSQGWPIRQPTLLVTFERHARRARLAFRQEGFQIDRVVVATDDNLPPARGLPRRLWYYAYPTYHALYEMAGYVLYALHVR